MPQKVDWFYLQKDIDNSTLSQEALDDLTSRLMFLESFDNEFSEIEIQDIIRTIKESVEDPILNARNYNQTDIRRHLKKLR